MFFLNGFEGALDEFTKSFRKDGEGFDDDVNVSCGEKSIDDNVFGQVLVKLIRVEYLYDRGQGVHIIDLTLIGALIDFG